MTKQEAIEYGLRWKNAICDRGDTEWSEAIQFLNAAIEALHEEREWIPVSERLPKQQEKIYWICTDHGYQCECRWTNVNHIWTWLTTDWHWHFADVPQYQKVVAWMPLPEPYEEGTDEKNEQDMRVMLQNAERPKGEWIYAKEQLEIIPMWECSCCRIRMPKKFKYCPNCGADMRGDE